MQTLRRKHLTIVTVIGLSSFAGAQSFDYPDFNSTSGLTLVGNAAAVGGVMRVTPAAASQRGAVWFNTPVNVVNGFTTTFRFQFTNPAASGADGLALVFQNDPRGTAAIGTNLQGSAIGYGDNAASPNQAIKNSLVLEIDTYDAGAPWNDPSGANFSWHTNGVNENNGYESQSIGEVTPSVDFTDGAVHRAEVSYSGGVLKVSYDGTLVLSTTYSFTTGGTWLTGGTVGGLNLIGGTSLYVGFTSATGGAWENNDLLEWTFVGGQAPPVVYCTSGTTTNGCLASISASANPSVSMASACTLAVANVEGQKNGILFYGLASNAAPWATGSNSTLCVKSPTQRTIAQASGGALNTCNGTFALDWNAFQTANPGALGTPWVVGEKAYVQAWFRDPPAVKTTNLSNAVELTYVP